MRITTVARRMLAVTSLFVTAVEFTTEALVLYVRPSWRTPRCGVCRRHAPGYDRKPRRFWRSLSLGRLEVLLAYAPRRVECPHCGVHTEAVPWARHRASFTKDFEEMVAYLVQTTDKTTVTKLMGISWRTVGAIVERIVAQRLDPRRLGVDEFSYRKRHRYRDVQRTNAPLYRAHLLKEMLAKTLDYLQPKRARRALDAWLA